MSELLIQLPWNLFPLFSLLILQSCHWLIPEYIHYYNNLARLALTEPFNMHQTILFGIMKTINSFHVGVTDTLHGQINIVTNDTHKKELLQKKYRTQTSSFLAIWLSHFKFWFDSHFKLELACQDSSFTLMETVTFNSIYKSLSNFRGRFFSDSFMEPKVEKKSRFVYKGVRLWKLYRTRRAYKFLTFPLDCTYMFFLLRLVFF